MRCAVPLACGGVGGVGGVGVAGAAAVRSVRGDLDGDGLPEFFVCGFGSRNRLLKVSSRCLRTPLVAQPWAAQPCPFPCTVLSILSVHSTQC